MPYNLLWPVGTVKTLVYRKLKWFGVTQKNRLLAHESLQSYAKHKSRDDAASPNNLKSNNPFIQSSNTTSKALNEALTNTSQSAISRFRSRHPSSPFP